MNENRQFPTAQGETSRRTVRNGAHVGFPTLLLGLAFEFGWFGINGWTAFRMGLVEGALIFGLATLHNLAETLGWVRDQRTPETT